MKNELIKSLNSKEIGPSIIDAAVEKHKQQQQEKVLKQVGDILERLQLFTTKKKNCELNIDLMNAQLKAIEKGDFTFNLQNFQIIFNDQALNRTWLDC